jgi:macrocin-O-methyltransferase TylF-like protien
VALSGPMLEFLKLLLRDVKKHGMPGRGSAEPRYDHDALSTEHNHEFMQDPGFRRAYARGVQATGSDYKWYWRVHVGLWAAACAAKLKGDFVECGVNYGFLASAIMESLDWDTLGKTFYLLDTFAGLDGRYVSKEEIEAGALEKNEEAVRTYFYVHGADTARRNFAQWRNVRIVVGSVPDTLPQVTADKVAFLHLDMNCAGPEVAAAAHFWPKLVPGAFVLLDDYAYRGYRAQKLAMDAFALEKGVPVASLPTGQGLIVKPPS